MAITVVVVLIVVDAQPRTENRQAFIGPFAVATLLHAWGPLEAPLDDLTIGCPCGVSSALSLSLSLSLSRWRKVGLPLEVWQESWPNFKGITKCK